MRVTSVELYSPRFEEPINFSLGDNDPNAQYMVRNILGLDAEEIVPRFYGKGLNTEDTLVGHKFYDFGLKPRDIVIRVVLNPRFKLDETYSDIRDDLYRTISATRTGKVVLHFKSGGTTVSRIFGVITRFEVPYFVQLPEVQFTVHCDDPMFQALNPVVFEPEDITTVNPVLISDSLSTAPHGFKMEVDFHTATPSFTIQDVETDPEWKFKIIPSGGFLVGDELYICSERSQKDAHIMRSGSPIQLMDRIEPTSVWPMIFPGSNNFFFDDIDTFDWNLIEYYASYWGV